MENQDAGFAQYWRQAYPSTLPVGYLLRENYPSRWLRIHSLPESKRWPESKPEFAEILRRHNTVLGALLRPSDHFTLLTTSYSDGPTPLFPSVFEADPTLKERSRYAFTGKPDADGPLWHFFVSPEVWEPGRWDAVLTQVASGTVADVLFVGSKWIYHPYDGGGDIIAPDETTRNVLRETFSSWTSQRKDGL